MKKITFAIGILLTATMFAAGGMFSACGSKDATTTGGAGTSGAAGTGMAVACSAGAPGAVGTPSMGAAGTGMAYPVTKADGTCAAGAFKHDGVCACQPDIPVVCSAGCTETKTDNDNCGACGAKCGSTSTCVAGACTPLPISLITPAPGCAATVGALDLGLSIAVVGGTLYVADAGHGTIKSYPAAGCTGPGTTIASGEKAPHALAVAGTTVAWISSVAMGMDPNGIVIIKSDLKAAKTTGGAATTLATGMNIYGGIQGVVLSTDGATVYFSKDTAINSVPAAGGTVTNVGNEDHGGIPGAMALTGTRLSYPTALNGDVDIMTIEAGKVASCGINGADGEADPTKQVNCLRVARSQGSLVLSTMASNAEKAFWADGTNLKANLTAPGSAQANENLAGAAEDIKGIALTATNVYFGYGEAVARLALVKDAVSVEIVRGQKMVSSVAVDGTKVYWGSNGDCTVNNTGL